MGILKPFEFGKSNAHTQSEVGSFLMPQPLKMATSWLKYIVVGSIVLYVGSQIYESKNAVKRFFSEGSTFGQSFFKPNISDQVEKLKADNVYPLPKIEAAIKSSTLNGEWIVLDEVRFATGTARLMDGRQLNGIAALLIDNPRVVIKVGGFTENSGNNAQDFELSAQRARNVAQKLANLGVSGENLYYEGFGASMPLCSEELSESCKTLNRRIAIQIQSK
jgi:outer membrane protein OmpA-like peptidoglycan-associated protein